MDLSDEELRWQELEDEAETERLTIEQEKRDEHESDHIAAGGETETRR